MATGRTDPILDSPVVQDPVFTWVYVDGDADDELTVVEVADAASRSLSIVTRTVRYGNDTCQLCQTNTDPKAVPLHPNCTCNIATEDVQIGQTPADHSNFRVIETADETVVHLSESDLPAAITMDPNSTGVLEIENLRFGDLARWLEQVEPLLSVTDTYLTIIQEFDEDAEQVAEIADALAEGAIEIQEAVSAKRIWFGVSKAVVGL